MVRLKKFQKLISGNLSNTSSFKNALFQWPHLSGRIKHAPLFVTDTRFHNYWAIMKQVQNRPFHC